MSNKLAFCTAIVGALVGVAAVPAHAAAVNVQLFSVTTPSPDFHSNPCGSCSEIYTMANPMVTYDGTNLISTGNNPTIAEGAGTALYWWTAGGTVASLGAGSYTLGTTQPMFVNGSNNTGGVFETAILTTHFVVSSGIATISYGGDDDTFLIVNGELKSQLGGIHQFTPGASVAVGPGTYDISLFYADRQITDAAVYLDVLGPNVTISGVPEASTWAMMLLGFVGVGFMAYRRKAQDAFRLV